MSWAKIDDQLHANEKFAAVSLGAIGLWTLCLSWAADRRSDGKLPLGIVRRFAGTETEALASELIAAGLWDAAESGWQIHNFLDYNPSRAEQESAENQLNLTRAEAGRRGAQSRWHGKTIANEWQSDSKPIAKPWQSDSKTIASRWQTDAPVPVPDPTSIRDVVDDDNPQTPMRQKADGEEAGLWDDAEKLTPGALLKRYREHFGPEGEERLAAWLAAARKPVQSQAAYLRPCILSWLRGEDPDPVTTPPPTAASPFRSMNAAAAAKAEALRAQHGTVAAALNLTTPPPPQETPT